MREIFFPGYDENFIKGNCENIRDGKRKNTGKEKGKKPAENKYSAWCLGRGVSIFGYK
jgi:hypothetical protein